MTRSRILGLVFIFFISSLAYLYAADETLTITTYYPSPYGVYKILRLYPNDDNAPGAACSNRGEMYFDESASTLYVCSGASGSSTWQPAGGGTPSGAVMFFNLSNCPAGWSPLDGTGGRPNARGRYLVGLPSGGQLEAAVGSALSDRENRPAGAHTHVYTGMFFGGGVGFGGGSNPIGTSAVTTGNGDYGGNPLKAGTNAPYLQLLLCQKS